MKFYLVSLFVLSVLFIGGVEALADVNKQYCRYSIVPMAADNSKSSSRHIVVDNITGGVWLLEIAKVKDKNRYKSQIVYQGGLELPQYSRQEKISNNNRLENHAPEAKSGSYAGELKVQ